MMNTESRPEGQRLYQQVGEELRRALERGDYKIGERLPPERDIAERFNVSRSVVREAFILLELQNLIDIRHGSGVYVTGVPAPSDKSGDEESIVRNDVGPFELLQARQLLESNIAAFAATQITKTDLVAMRAALEQEREKLSRGDTDYTADEEFHKLIARATQNGLMLEMVELLWKRRLNSPMWNRLHVHIIDQGYRKKWQQDHLAILNALQLRDSARARQTMWQHLENVKQTLLKLSDVDDPEFDGYLFSTNPLVPEHPLHSLD
ncbi:MAG: FCD domain-containing protein [Methylobacteriaceae bacterium]|jgi:GntR family uxuAB operon transcriptional repressor|nr:FCD domain-containing protein [Methylobacteriaceae bacterium]